MTKSPWWTHVRQYRATNCPTKTLKETSRDPECKRAYKKPPRVYQVGQHKWVDFVKAYKAKTGLPWRWCLVEASPLWQAQKVKPPAPEPPVRITPDEAEASTTQTLGETNFDCAVTKTCAAQAFVPATLASPFTVTF
jgi:hypothetical protein